MYENRLQPFSLSDTFGPFLGLLNAIQAFECFAVRYVFGDSAGDAVTRSRIE
jgi:hypothetical protein